MIQLTRAQLREIDRRCVDDYHMPSILLMENAAHGAARIARQMLDVDLQAKAAGVLILCGGGNNGGDGLAIGRHLHNAGYAIRFALTVDPARYTGDALTNYNIVRAMGLTVETASAAAIDQRRPALIIDAIFGTGLMAAPRSPFADLVGAVSRSAAPVLAVDIPSGLDCDTGQPLGPTIHATRTVTFVAEKIGFVNPAAADFLGVVDVVGIGAPAELLIQVRETVI